MSYTVLLAPEAEDDLDRLDRSVEARIRSWMTNMLEGCDDPYHNAKPLKGIYAGKYRYHVGGYRVCVMVDPENEKILVLAIRKRSRAYHRRRFRRGLDARSRNPSFFYHIPRIRSWDGNTATDNLMVFEVTMDGKVQFACMKNATAKEIFDGLRARDSEHDYRIFVVCKTKDFCKKNRGQIIQDTRQYNTLQKEGRLSDYCWPDAFSEDVHDIASRTAAMKNLRDAFKDSSSIDIVDRVEVVNMPESIQRPDGCDERTWRMYLLIIGIVKILDRRMKGKDCLFNPSELKAIDMSDQADPEPFTRYHIIQPILTQLGYDHILPEYHLDGGKVDFMARTGPRTKKVLIETKGMGKLFRKKPKATKKNPSPKSPIDQIVSYVTVTDRSIGLLTDGLRWLLVNKRGQSICFELFDLRDYFKAA